MRSFVGVLLISALAMVLYGVIAISVLVYTEKHCLAAGYPDYRVDMALNSYCIKIVDHTSVVTLLKDVKDSE